MPQPAKVEPAKNLRAMPMSPGEERRRYLLQGRGAERGRAWIQKATREVEKRNRIAREPESSGDHKMPKVIGKRRLRPGYYRDDQNVWEFLPGH